MERIRECEQCGKIDRVLRGPLGRLCQACQFPKKSTGVCQLCQSAPAKSKYCVDCRKIKRREIRLRREERKRAAGIPIRNPLARNCKACGISVGKGKSYCAECKQNKRKLGYRRYVEVNTQVAQCKECGVAFTSIRGAQFCCQSCNSNYYHRLRGGSLLKDSPVRHCEVCGKEFKRRKRDRDAARCCSWECGQVLSMRHLAQRAKAAAKSIEARRAVARFRKLYERLRQCPICKLAFVAKQDANRFCGKECRAEDQRRNAGGYGETKPCRLCGDNVPPQYGPTGRQNRPRYCRPCREDVALIQRRIQRRKRKQKDGQLRNGVTAKNPAAAIINSLRRLIAKAKGTCPVCRQAMARGFDPNSDRAMEFDHYMPLSKGGTDTFDNVRPICRKCNGMKAAFVPIEYLLQN